MSVRNLFGRTFEITHLLLGLVIIRGVPASILLPPTIFIAKYISSIINYFSIFISTFGSLVSPGSISFRYRSLWIVFLSGACACLIFQGKVVLEVPFLVA